MPLDLVLVVDYGAQYAQLIARRVREAHVYSEIVPHTMPVAEMMARQPKAIVLSGGPASVFEPNAPQTDPALFAGGVPVFGILASAIVAWFSRRREFRADRGSANLLGSPRPMIGALARLGGLHAGGLPDSVKAFGIASESRLAQLFATHPSIEARIAALQASA